MLQVAASEDYQHKTDQRFDERMTDILLDAMPRTREEGGVKLALGSHNVRSIASALEGLDRRSLPRESLEIQMLHGMADQLKDAAAEMNGHSLLPAIEDGRAVRDSFYCETYMPAHKGFAEPLKIIGGKTVRVGVQRAGIVRPPYKLIRTQLHPLYSYPKAWVPPSAEERLAGDELYDLSEDPGETSPLDVTQYSEVFDELAAMLEAHSRKELARSHGDEIDIDEGHVDKLRSLGYVD